MYVCMLNRVSNSKIYIKVNMDKEKCDTVESNPQVVKSTQRMIKQSK